MLLVIFFPFSGVLDTKDVLDFTDCNTTLHINQEDTELIFSVGNRINI